MRQTRPELIIDFPKFACEAQAASPNSNTTSAFQYSDRYAEGASAGIAGSRLLPSGSLQRHTSRPSSLPRHHKFVHGDSFLLSCYATKQPELDHSRSIGAHTSGNQNLPNPVIDLAADLRIQTRQLCTASGTKTAGPICFSDNCGRRRESETRNV